MLARRPHSLQPVRLDDGGLSNGSVEAQQCGPDPEGVLRCWPRLFIIGAQKAATTSLWTALTELGTACGAGNTSSLPRKSKGRHPHTAKENHVFDMAESQWKELVEQPLRYKKLYLEANCPSRQFVDGTPRYIRNPVVPGRLKRLMPSGWMPELRMVLLIREPIARDLSWFNHRLGKMEEAKKKGKYKPGRTSDSSFCSKLNNETGYPEYGEEVKCNQEELELCMLRARSRLDSLPVGEQLEVDIAGGKGEEERLFKRKLREYQECVDDIWGYKRGATKIHHVDRDIWGGQDPLELSWGFYLPQMRAWTARTGVERSQLLVIDFERLVTDAGDALPRVTKFMGLPDLSKNELPHENEKLYEHKVSEGAATGGRGTIRSPPALAPLLRTGARH